MAEDAAPAGAPAPGATTDITITYLEMTERPASPAPPLPVAQRVALIKAHEPPDHYFVYLYSTVGAAHDWTDLLRAGPEARARLIRDPRVELYTMLLDGFPGGFFMLDTRVPGICDLAYFGLMPEAIGRGLGHWLLATAIEMAWQREGVAKLTVNTCTLDHPRALGNYQRAGFSPVRRETVQRPSGGAMPACGTVSAS